jgi:hypothetical protein
VRKRRVCSMLDLIFLERGLSTRDGDKGGRAGATPPYACDFHRKISHASFIFKLI